MSNKKWRTPADGTDADREEFKHKANEELDRQQAGLQQPTGQPELDRGYAALQMAAGVRPTAATDAEPVSATAPATEPPPTATASASEQQPIGGPTRCAPDMRTTSGLFNPGGRTFGPLEEGEAIQMLGDLQRFLWKIVRITMDIVDSVPLGELRRVVAEDIAMPGDIVSLDGKLTRGMTPGVERDRRKGPRGSAHPLMTLLKFALHAAKVLRQTNEGTHPELQNRVARKEMLNAVKRAEDWIKEVVAGRA
jgi:hypothetical protein